MIKSELNIGKVLKPRGIKGEMKIETYSPNPSRFQKLRAVTIQGKEYAVKNLYLEGVFAYIKLDGIDTPEQVEELRNKLVFAKRNDLPKLEEGSYYIADLIGATVYVGDNKLGVLKDILQYGSADVYICKTEKGDVSFPALKDLIISTDVMEGIIKLDPKRFEEVAILNE